MVTAVPHPRPPANRLSVKCSGAHSTTRPPFSRSALAGIAPSGLTSMAHELYATYSVWASGDIPQQGAPSGLAEKFGSQSQPNRQH